ncbi:hypothetical protein SAMN06295912_11241 [Sphingomonas laterariae]|uniref:Uncharacterized protein n=1 Tax=Edaphosphingomonas laterariae TaxID=861865 RepID=A0A239GH18_9SPHN|nr:hypothetical protein [Sphingomonas laterariae]SNS67773.1 hypothetical protein SAMN06295912_11241 [Sphingomonas laterariae]
MATRKPHADQLTLELAPGDELDRIIEQRAAEMAEAQAVIWRFRLIVIESFMLAALLLAAGLALDLPAEKVVFGAGVAGGGCLLTGVALIALTDAASRLLTKFRRKA